MRRSRPAGWIIHVVCLLALTAACGTSDNPIVLPGIFVPSAEAASISEAVAMLTDGGIIRLGAGVYSENIVIEGDRLIQLIGAGASGPDATRIVAFDSQLPVLQINALASGIIQDLRLEGGVAGLMGRDDMNDCGGETEVERPGPVTVERVGVEGSLRGVTGSFSTLDLTGVDVSACTSHGVSLAADTLTVCEGRYHMNTGVGLYVNNKCDESASGEICI